MNAKEIQELIAEIKKIVRRRLDDGMPELIKSDLEKLRREIKIPKSEMEKLRKLAEQDIMEIWVATHKLPKTASYLDIAIAKTKNGLIKGVLKTVSRGLREDLSKSDLSTQLQREYGIAEGHARTISITARLGANKNNLLEQSLEAGAKKFRYVGAPPEREFCVYNYNKVKTLKEWRAMDNGQGLPVVPYCGGWHCKHTLEPEFE